MAQGDEAARPPAYTVAARTPMGGAAHWDLLAVEPKTHRVFVTHDNELTVVDGGTGTVVGHVQTGGVSHGVAFVASNNTGWTDDSLSATAIAFDLTTLKVISRVSTAPGADVVIYNPLSARVLVLDGKGRAATVIDSGTRKVVGELALLGQPESAVIDRDGSVFVQLTDTQEIIHLDAAATRILGRHSIADCAKPRGLAFDPQTRRLFSSCLNQRLLITDAESGGMVASLAIGIGTDTAVFDQRSKRIFSPNADGSLSVIQEQGADHFTALPPVSTAPGARTMALDVSSGRIFLPTAKVQARGDADQYGRVKLTFEPGSAFLLVLNPAP